MVLGAPDRVNIPCLMHDTRLCQLDVKMTNNYHGTKGISIQNLSRCNKQVYTTYYTSSQKTRHQKLNSYLVMNSLGDSPGTVYIYIYTHSYLDYLPPYLYIPPPSVYQHGFSFTDVELSLCFMFNFTLFYLSTLLSANIFFSPKGGG